VFLTRSSHLRLWRACTLTSASPVADAQWPTGEEQGEYLALDLGGTNLRVCLVTLLGAGKFEVTQTKYRLTEEQKQEDGQKL